MHFIFTQEIKKNTFISKNILLILKIKKSKIKFRLTQKKKILENFLLMKKSKMKVKE